MQEANSFYTKISIAHLFSSLKEHYFTAKYHTGKNFNPSHESEIN